MEKSVCPKGATPCHLWVPQEEDSETAFPQINPADEKKQDGVMQEGKLATSANSTHPLEFKRQQYL